MLVAATAGVVLSIAVFKKFINGKLSAAFTENGYLLSTAFAKVCEEVRAG
jgi:hypothetical protein